MERVLKKRLIEKIASSPLKAIPFDEFMRDCLYDPQFGYYTGGKVRIGKKGDFYTSSSIGTIMGELLAEYFAKILTAPPFRNGQIQNGRAVVAEWGGGTGRLARQIWGTWSRRHPRLPASVQWVSVEASPTHCAEQKRELAESGVPIPVRWMDGEEWLKWCATRETPVLLFSNELVDAFPVKRVCFENGGWREIWVGWDVESGEFKEKTFPLDPGSRLAAHVDRLCRTLAARGLGDARGFAAETREIAANGQRWEISLAGLDWYRRVARALPKGSVMVTIDYGDLSEELYAPHRRNGTLMCYYRHMAHDNPYIHVGEQDITAHVNFSDLIATGVELGWEQWTFQTQKQFLLEQGILGKLSEHAETDPFSEPARRNRAVRQLLLDDSLGRLFKVLIQRKTRGAQ